MDPFFQNRGHTKFRKIDPFSVDFRTMMRTYLELEWRDRVTHKPAKLKSCARGPKVREKNI